MSILQSAIYVFVLKLMSAWLLCPVWGSYTVVTGTHLYMSFCGVYTQEWNCRDLGHLYVQI
jgi:hypothetical protein